MTRALTCLGGLALLFGLLLPAALAQPPTEELVVYEARLSCGDIATGRETLACAHSDAAGAAAWAQARVEGADLVIHGSYEGLTAPVLQDVAKGVHLHRDAELYHLDTLIRGLSSEGATEGTFYGRIRLTDEYLSMLRLGRMYLDIHTATYPAGEIHGRLVPLGPQGSAAW